MICQLCNTNHVANGYECPGIEKVLALVADPRIICYLPSQVRLLVAIVNRESGWNLSDGQMIAITDYINRLAVTSK